MGNETLNAELAKAMGWKLEIRQCEDGFLGFGTVDVELLQFPDGKWRYPHDFTPATDRNDLALYVLPEIKRRGLWKVLDENLEYAWARSEVQTVSEYLLTADPAVLAAAALKVLQEASHAD